MRRVITFLLGAVTALVLRMEMSDQTYCADKPHTTKACQR